MDIKQQFSKIKKDMTSELRIVTPKWAREMLERNNTEECPNRPIAISVLNAMKVDLLDGRWEHGGWDAIAFDKSGYLINGQTRLMAVAQTGVPIIAVVLYGLGGISKEVGDTTRTRTFNHALVMSHTKNYNTVASIVRIVAQYETTGLFHKPKKLTNAFLREVLTRHPRISEDAEWRKSVSSQIKLVGRPNIIAGMRYITRVVKGHASEAEIFFDQLATGCGCTSTDPAYALRCKMQNALQSEMYQEPESVAMDIAYAWNKFLAGKRCKRIPANASVSGVA